MKRVLLISPDSANHRLYRTGLSKHFRIILERGAQVDAVVVDIPQAHTSIELRWIKKLDLPTVVMTSEDNLPLPAARNRCVLTYPVRMDRLLKALSSLGIEPENVES